MLFTGRWNNLGALPDEIGLFSGKCRTAGSYLYGTVYWRHTVKLLVPLMKYPKTGIKDIYGKMSVRV